MSGDPKTVLYVGDIDGRRYESLVTVVRIDGQTYEFGDFGGERAYSSVSGCTIQTGSWNLAASVNYGLLPERDVKYAHTDDEIEVDGVRYVFEPGVGLGKKEDGRWVFKGHWNYADYPNQPEWEPIEFDDISRGDRLRVTYYGAHTVDAYANHLHTPLGTRWTTWQDRLNNAIARKGREGQSIFRHKSPALKTDPGDEASGPVAEYGRAVAEIEEPVRFALIREFDVSGGSGTGRIADGVLWTDGSVALRWRGDNPSTAVWARIEDAIKVHGHGGFTKVRWIDIPPEWFRLAVGLAM